LKTRRNQVNIKAIKRKFPASSGHLELFARIQNAASSISFKPPPKIAVEKLNESLSTGITVLDACSVSLDTRAFAAALKKLFELLSTRNPEKFSKTSSTAVPDELMDNYLCARKNKLTGHAETLGIEPVELISCCQQAARPQLVSLRETNNHANLTIWSYGHCPFCGALPAMAHVERSGIRHLNCPNCLAVYRFKRHYCPNCAHAGLEVLQMDAWPGLLLEKCPSCGTYLKTWDGTAGQPPCPFPYLDIVTRDVDEAAEAQNLTRMSLSVMGV
jgi:formate dehydrogenase maturation protein FdhE